MCIGAECNEPLKIPAESVSSLNGNDGQSAFVYYASADDAAGTNFVLGNDPTKAYRAILTSTTEITTPIVSNFTGKWFKALGTDGTNGTNGTVGTNGRDAGLEYIFLGYSASGDPGVGYLSFNSSQGDSTSVLAINETTAAGAVIDNTLDIVDISTSIVTALIKITKKGDPTKFILFSANVSADAGSYFNIGVQHLDCTDSVTHKPFTAGDHVTVEFYLSGMKGDTGATGGAGNFIIADLDPDGCIAVSNPYNTNPQICSSVNTLQYPHPSLKGNAYRFTSDGYIGTANTRVFINDVLYCHTDTTVLNDATKFFIWAGTPRAFKPGTGTDAYIQNTVAPGLAAGTSAIVINDSGVASGAQSVSLNAGNATNTNTIAGQGGTASGSSAISIGVGSSAAAASSMIFGASSTVNSGAIHSKILGHKGNVDASSLYSTVVGSCGSADATGSFVMGGGDLDGTFANVGLNQRQIVPLFGSTVGATSAILKTTFNGNVLGLLTRTNRWWFCEINVRGLCTATSGAPVVGQSISYWGKFVFQNLATVTTFADTASWVSGTAGTAVFAAKSLTGTYFQSGATLTGCTLVLSASTPYLVITVTGVAAATISWTGSIDIHQSGY